MGNCCVSGTIIAVKLNEAEKIKIKRKSLNQKFETVEISARRGIPNQKRGSVYQFNDENILSFYDFSRKLGIGYFGTVKLANPKNDLSKQYAVKSIDKSKLSAKKIENLSREIEVLASLDHPNIVKYYETYNDDQFFHIVMEYLEGGELFTQISNKKKFSEYESADIIYKITSAISHCHANGIVHRDLKPENILFETLGGDNLKIVDFGLSRKFIKNELHSIVGSPYYVAPEVLEGKYDTSCDVWGIGVIMYVLLCGKLPFYHENKTELFKKIKNDPIPFDNKIWTGVSIEAVELIKILLNKNPHNRPKTEKILEYSWFSKYHQFTPRRIDPEIMTSLKNFREPGQLIKLLIKIIVKETKSSEIENLNKTFMMMDRNKTGYIDTSLIQLSLSGNLFNNSLPPMASRLSTNNFIKITTNEGLPMNNQIDYSSFIALALRHKNLLNKEVLMDTFKHLDVDNSGYLTVKNFEIVLKRTGKIKNKEEIVKMFKEYGYDENVKINFDEFCVFIEQSI